MELTYGIGSAVLRDPILRWIRRSGFPGVTNLEGERRKLDLCRIALGLIASHRFAKVAWASFYYYEPASGLPVSRQFLVALAISAVLFLYTIGFLVPSMGLILVLCYWAASTYTDSQTLGDSMFLIAAWILLLSNCGTHYSLDSFLMKRWAFARRQYEILKFPTAEQQTFLYLTGFLIFGLVSMAAISLHVHDEAWRSGMTLKLLLLSSYFSRFYATFRSWDAAYPHLLSIISITAAIGQTVFQLFMIPLAFHRIGLAFVRVWGMIFFIACLLFIQLSYLPAIELILWPLILFPVSARTKVTAADHPFPQRSFHVSRGIALLVLTSIGTFLFSVIPVERLKIRSETALYLLKTLGYDVPNVFNKADLETGEKWVVLFRVYPDGREEQVPLNTLEGGRDSYHQFDPLYYGNSLRWRRHMIRRDVETEHHARSYAHDLLSRVCAFDYRLRGRPNLKHYRAEIFGNEFSNLSLNDLDARYRAKRLYSFVIPEPR